jgi:hypothetical protein
MNVIPVGARLNWVNVASSEVRLADARHYFRAIVNPESFVGPPFSLPPVQVATFGIWRSGDFALTETQMIRSAEHVGRPMALRTSRRTGATGCNWMHRAGSTRVSWTSSRCSSPGSDAVNRSQCAGSRSRCFI